MHVPSFRYFMDSICCVIARTSWNPVLSPDMCWKYASFSTWTDRLFTPASFKMAVTYKLEESEKSVHAALKKWCLNTWQLLNMNTLILLELSKDQLLWIYPNRWISIIMIMLLADSIVWCAETDPAIKQRCVNLCRPAVWSSAPPHQTWSGGGWSLRPRWLNVSKNEGLCTTQVLQSSQSETTQKTFTWGTLCLFCQGGGDAILIEVWTRVNEFMLVSDLTISTYVCLRGKIWGRLTFSSALFRFFSFSGGVRSRRTSQASFSRGMTLRKMSVAMKSEQMGSAINQPNWRMRMVEMITPTLPKVSARTCRKTPGEHKDTSITSGFGFLWTFLSQTHTSHVSVHASTPWAVGVPVSAVAMSPMCAMSVTSMRVAMTPVAVFAVGVAMVRVAVVIWWTAFAAMGVSVTKSADTHQVDQQSSDRHGLQRTKITTQRKVN